MKTDAIIKDLVTFALVISLCIPLCVLADNEPDVKDFTSEFVSQCKAKAKAGDPEGQALYGRALSNGWGVKKNPKAAVEWLEKSAEAGNPIGQCTLGRCYALGLGVDKDAVEAAAWLSKAAEQGLPRAQFFLGVSYETGSGIEKNEAKAIELYRKSAEQGFDGGQYAIGVRLVQEKDVAKQNEGVEWLTKAAEQGNADAQTVLGIYYGDKDAAQSLAWYRQAADQGVGKAQWEVGRTLHLSNDKTKQREAIPWLTKAAEQGVPKAMMVLGRCYADGIGVEKNMKKAILWNKKGAELNVIPCMIWLSLNDPNQSQRHDWLLKGAQLGDANCQYLAGMNYHNGTGVAKDNEKAMDLFSNAAVQGHKEALLEGGGWTLFKGAWGNKNYAEAAIWLRKLIDAGDQSANLKMLLGTCEYELGHAKESYKWCRQAAEQGFAAAQYVTGINLLYGEGVEKDVDLAIFWMKKAAEQGHEDAKKKLTKLNVE